MIQTSSLNAEEQAQLDQLRQDGLSLPDGRMLSVNMVSSQMNKKHFCILCGKKTAK